MLLRYVFLSVLGLSFGLMAAGGVFTVLIAVGLIPRFAGKTHTADHVLLYENMVILGTLFGGLVSVYEWGDLVGRTVVQDWSVPYMAWRIAGSVFLILYGFFAGIFVGSLAMAIAEMLDSIPIFSRRVGFRQGLGIVVLAMALGKMTGSFVYFWKQIFMFGG